MKDWALVAMTVIVGVGLAYLIALAAIAVLHA